MTFADFCFYSAWRSSFGLHVLTAFRVCGGQEPDIRFIRRMQRDIAERGRTVDEVVAQFLGTVRPMHELFVTPSKVCSLNSSTFDLGVM